MFSMLIFNLSSVKENLWINYRTHVRVKIDLWCFIIIMFNIALLYIHIWEIWHSLSQHLSFLIWLYPSPKWNLTSAPVVYCVAVKWCTINLFLCYFVYDNLYMLNRRISEYALIGTVLNTWLFQENFHSC